MNNLQVVLKGSFAEEFNKHLEQTNQINSIQDHIDHDITNTLNKKKPQVPDKNSLKEVEINGSMELGSNPSEPTTQLLREKSEDKRKIFLKANFEQETLDWNNEEDVRILMELIKKPLKRKLEMTWLSKLLQEIPFFRKLAESISQQAFVSLIKKISHEFVPKHSPVFRKGDFGTKYYVILQGKVAILGDRLGINPFNYKSPDETPAARIISQNKTPVQGNSSQSKAITPVSEKRRRFKETHASTTIIRPSLTRSPTMTSGRATRRGAETSKLTILEPGLGDGSPRSPKTRRNATEATPQSRYSRHSGTSSQKSSRGSPAVSQNENKISLFKRGHVPQLHLVKKSGFTNAVQEVMNSETSRKEDNSNGPQLKKKNSNSLVEENESEMNDMSDEQFEDFLEYSFPFERFIKSLDAGVGFGELALIGNARRTATVVTMKDTHFAVLNKATYDEILKDFHEDLYREKLTFLQNIPLFHDWSDMKLASLLMIFEIKTVSRNTILYSTNEEPESVYLIRSGEVELIESITIEEKSTQGKLNQSELDNLYIQKKDPNKLVKKVIARIGPGSIFGEEEIFENVKRKYTTVVSTSKAELYIIKKKKFLDSLKGSTAFERLYEQYETKKVWRTGLKKQINQSIVNIEEKKKEHITSPPQDKVKLKTQLKLINTRLIIQSPTGTKSDSFRISKTEPNEIISPDGLNSGKRTLIKEEYELNSSLNKTKGDTSIINHSKSPETYLRPQSSSNLFKARESLKKLTLTSKLKPSSPEAQSQRTNLRIKTPKVIDGLSIEKNDVIIEGGSPRISSKPLMAFYDLEIHPSMYANPINSSNRSNSPSVEKPQRSPTARQTIDDLKLFGKPSISYIKPRRHSQRKNLKLTKNLDIVKPFFSPEKTKASIYSRISGLNGILSTSPTLSKKSPEYRLGTSNAFLMSEMSVTPNKSVLATHHDLEKGRPRTSYYSSFEDKQLHNKSSGYNNLFNNSLGQFPLNHVISGSPNKSQIHNSPPKEFVNIHVQKLHEKPRPKVKGRFFFPSPSARLSTK